MAQGTSNPTSAGIISDHDGNYTPGQVVPLQLTPTGALSVALPSEDPWSNYNDDPFPLADFDFQLDPFAEFK